MRISRMVSRLAAALLSTYCLVSEAYPLPDGTPEEMNMSTEKLNKITTKLQRLSDRGIIPGASFTVLRGGKRIYQGSAGFADISAGTFYNPDTLVRIMSQSKPVTAVAAMILVDEGKLKLTDPIHMWNPRFKDLKVESTDYWTGEHTEIGHLEPLKRDITVFDLLTFQGGFSYSYDFIADNEGPVDFPEFSPFNLLSMSMLTIDELVENLIKIPLVCQPGEMFYYGWSYDVLGYIIQKVTGQSLAQFYAERIFTPLQMWDTGFFVPSEKMDRFAAQYTATSGSLSVMVRPRADPLQGYRMPRLMLGGAGIISTANDYALFAQMLLNGGELNGKRILSEGAVDLMWRNHLRPDQLPYSLNGWTSDEDTGYGIGLSITTEDRVTKYNWDKHTGGARAGEVGWGGGASTSWQASAEHDIVVSFATQLLDGPGTETFFEIVWPGVNDAIKGPSPRPLPGTVPAAPKKNAPKIKNPEGNTADKIRTEKRRQLREVPIRPF